MSSLAKTIARPAKSVAALAEEYAAVREATRALAQNQPQNGYDHSALGLAYHPLKHRNQLAVLINRAMMRPVIPAFPFEVQINNIAFCNLRCPQCPTHGTDERHEVYQAKSYTMARATLEKITTETYPYAQKTATSGLGEGLLHKDLDALITAAWRYGVNIFTNSNGTTLLPKILGGLFGVTELRLSLDGATPAAFEAVRLGANFAKVMRNVLVVTRANEGLPQSLRLNPTVNFGICASNARDIPLMVDLCQFLGLRTLYGFRIGPLNPRYLDDDIRNYPAYYKHYYLLAMQRARGRQIAVTLPAPDPDIEPDADAGPGNASMIVGGVDDSYYLRLPNYERLIDTDGIEADVEAMMTAALEAGIARHEAARPASVREATEHARQLDAELAGQLQRGMATLSAEEVARLRSMHKSDKLVPDCLFLQAHLVYTADGAARPCCDATIAPVGDVSINARDILRGEKLRALLEEFRTQQFRPDCARCPVRQMVPERHVFPLPLS